MAMVFYLHEDDEDASTISMVREEYSQHSDTVLIRNEDFGTALDSGQAGVTQRVSSLPSSLSDWLDPAQLYIALCSKA